MEMAELKIEDFNIPARIRKAANVYCKQGGYSVHRYIAGLICEDVMSRFDAGWTVKDGWAAKEKLEAKRAASFKKTPPRKK